MSEQRRILCPEPEQNDAALGWQTAPERKLAEILVEGHDDAVLLLREQEHGFVRRSTGLLPDRRYVMAVPTQRRDHGTRKVLIYKQAHRLRR